MCQFARAKPTAALRASRGSQQRYESKPRQQRYTRTKMLAARAVARSAAPLRRTFATEVQDPTKTKAWWKDWAAGNKQGGARRLECAATMR